MERGEIWLYTPRIGGLNNHDHFFFISESWRPLLTWQLLTWQFKTPSTKFYFLNLTGSTYREILIYYVWLNLYLLVLMTTHLQKSLVKLLCIFWSITTCHRLGRRIVVESLGVTSSHSRTRLLERTKPGRGRLVFSENH